MKKPPHDTCFPIAKSMKLDSKTNTRNLLDYFLIISILTFILVAAIAVPGNSQTAPFALDEVVKKIQQVYTRHCCFRAHFDQLTVNVAMDMKDRFKGTMYVKKPGMIALEVESPEKQHVVISGRSYTVYFPEDGSATSGEVPPEMNLEHFFGFFANIGTMDKNFSISIPPKSHDPGERLLFLELADLKNPKSAYTILVGIDDEQYTIRRAIIYDALGNYNRFDLTRITFMDSVPDSKFQLLRNAKETLSDSLLKTPKSDSK